jgi:hypothetical protein
MGVAMGVLLAVVTGCSSGDDASDDSAALDGSVPAPVVTPAPTTPPPTPATAAATVAVSSAPAVVVTTAPATAAPTTLPDGATVLQQSFDLLAPGYHFVTTASVNGTPALTAEGDHIAGSTRMTITSQGRSVEYIVLPEQTWVADAGQWQELEQAAPASDPITALRTPESVTVASYSPELTTLTAAYPPSALNAPGDQPVPVTFELAGTTLLAIAYEVPGGGSTVRSDISPLVDPTPITSPAGE